MWSGGRAAAGFIHRILLVVAALRNFVGKERCCSYAAAQTRAAIETDRRVLRDVAELHQSAATAPRRAASMDSVSE